MKVRAIFRNDGGVSIIRPATKSRKKDESEAAWLKRVFERCTKEAGLEGFPFEDIDSKDLPSRDDRKYWTKKTSGGIKVDSSKKKSDEDSKTKKRDTLKSKLGLTDKELNEFKEIIS